MQKQQSWSRKLRIGLLSVGIVHGAVDEFVGPD